MATATSAPPKLKLITENEQVQHDASAAEEALATVLEFAKTTRRSWWRFGDALATVTKSAIWKEAEPIYGPKYHSFEDFINRTFESARSSAYRAIQLRTELSTLSPVDADRITLVKAMWLLRLKKRCGESKWCSPKFIDAAVDKKVTEERFAEMVQEAMPGAAKEEDRVKTTFYLAKSQAKRHAKVFKVARYSFELPDDASEEEVLEAVEEFFMNSQCERATFKASNEEFFDGKGKKKAKAKK